MPITTVVPIEAGHQVEINVLATRLESLAMLARGARNEHPDAAAESLADLVESTREIADRAEKLIGELTGDPSEVAP
jgi:hypothetical protein